MTEYKILSFYIPCPDLIQAKILVTELISRGLIACGNIIDAESMYVWNGSIHQEPEKIAILKTTLLKDKDCEAAIALLHPYDCPCIARYEMAVNEAYYNWVKSTLI